MKIPSHADNLTEVIKSTQQKAFLFSLFRLFLFLLLGATLIVGLSDNRLLLLLLLPGSIIFVWLIKRFNEYNDQVAFLKELQQMNVERTKRADRNLEQFDPGTEFMDKSHPFCNDLDLFGPHSLFQLINHTVSRSGRSLLAQKIKSQISPDIQGEKITAIDELSTKNDFNRNFEAIGRAFIKDEKNKQQFYHWLENPEKWKPLYTVLLVIGPLGGFSVLIAVLFGIIHASWIGLWIILGMVTLSMLFKPLQQATLIWPNQGDVKTFRLWSELLEKETFQSKFLQLHHRPFQEGQLTKGFKSLEQTSFLVQNRLNLVYLIFNLIFWLDFPLMWKLKNWKNQFGDQLSHIESLLDEWQLLVSLASFSKEENLTGQVNWTEDTVIQASNLTHPLLSPSIAVGNDFELDQNTKTILLTGANMSGKTTFMRALGVNLVLINLGLRPFASTMSCGPFKLYTSMRNTDNLGESVSSFYAELARIRQILQASEKGENVFFLMDEILKGTNTTDRIMGSEALIRQLAATLAKGIISTHDIELSQLENQYAYLQNRSFHSEIDDREIRFDYKLKEGPCPSFNAHKLMELMGIKFQ